MTAFEFGGDRLFTVRVRQMLFQPEAAVMSLILLTIVAIAALYWFPVRRWFGRWGTTRGGL